MTTYNKFLQYKSVYLDLVVGQVLLICDTDDNLHQLTYVILSVSQCCISLWFLVQVLSRDLANFSLLGEMKIQRLLLLICWFV
jgi:hypothetical protein